MIKDWLRKTNDFWFASYVIFAAFGVYFCMYAFRKPFTVATFDGLQYGGGLDYKILLVMAQVLGYMFSKFLGIKIIAELSAKRRAVLLIACIGLAELALLGFALVPPPYNVIFLLVNGIPLGMVWGIVFSYLEGRRLSEILGVGLSASFIVSSGVVKSVGKALLLYGHVSDYWMPFVAGLLFLLPLLGCTFLLEQIPPPSTRDEAIRTKREAMNGRERRQFVGHFAIGLGLLVVFYMVLTAFRDFRDNFSAEIWAALNSGNNAAVFTWSEVPATVIVFVVSLLIIRIQNHIRAFMVYQYLIVSGCVWVLVGTWLYQAGWLPPLIWMQWVGVGLYVAYVPFNCILFDRLLAAFHYKGNAGFMIYVADSFGYLGSVGVLLYKNFGQPDVSWLHFFTTASYVVAVTGMMLVGLSGVYFYWKYKKGHEGKRIEPKSVFAQ